jgi:hypothetical protein
LIFKGQRIYGITCALSLHSYYLLIKLHKKINETKMKHHYHSKNRLINLYKLISAKASRLVLATVIMSFAGTSIAAWKGDTDKDDYVDSVTKWGAWELDIEPAAGGLQQSSSQIINARDSKVTLRTNSIAALAPQRPGIPATPAVPAVPAIPATPTTPAVPAVPAIPAAPNIPAPPAATPPVIVTLP